MSRLYVADPSGSYSIAKEDELLAAATAIITRKLKRSARLTSPAEAKKFLPILLGHRDHEVFCVAFLDTRHRVIAFEQMFRGTVDGASVHPREVVKSALRHNAAAVIFVHNHPSGSPEPSTADELITKRLKEGLALIDIRVLDHFIVGGTEVLSMAERGLV